MILNRKNFSRLLVVLSGLAIAVGGLTWAKGPPGPVAAQGPQEETASLTLKVVSTENGFTIAALDSVPTFDVGDRFKLSIVAQGVGDPGIFGSQFELKYDPVHVGADESTLTSGLDLQPVVAAVANVDNAAGLASYAASRQGDLENVSGDVVLASIIFEALSPTEPPEGQTTTIALQNVKLGAKGGLEVPVSGLVNLDIIIRGDGGAGEGDIEGMVTVEGRTADNQAGHAVTAAGDLGNVLTAMTESDGSFLIKDAPADTYEVTAGRAGFLAATCDGVGHSADALTSLQPVTLLAGDIDSSDEIDITDAVAIGAAFGSISGEIADLDDSGEVDVLDLILMAANFGQTSAGNPWVCQLGEEL